jgi:hypothetical protein
MKAEPLAAADIERLFDALNRELAGENIHGDVYLVGGAVMCLVHAARETTQDLDAWFQPADELHRGSFRRYLDLSHLTVYTAEAEYLLAMKCLSARIGEEFHDVDDIQYLLRYLNLTDAASAKAIVEKYYPLERFPQKTLYLLEELLDA